MVFVTFGAAPSIPLSISCSSARSLSLSLSRARAHSFSLTRDRSRARAHTHKRTHAQHPRPQHRFLGLMSADSGTCHTPYPRSPPNTAVRRCPGDPAHYKSFHQSSVLDFTDYRAIDEVLSFRQVHACSRVLSLARPRSPALSWLCSAARCGRPSRAASALAFPRVDIGRAANGAGGGLLLF